jgi:hypothetical protein
MAESKTSVCNMSLARFGAIRINDFDDASEAGTSIIYCRLFFDQTAKALMRIESSLVRTLTRRTFSGIMRITYHLTSCVTS